MVSKSIIDYLKYEVVTKTEVFYENQMVFPAVTICVDIQKHPNSNSIREIYNFICKFENLDCEQNFFELNYLNKACLRYNGGKNFTNNSITLKTSIS